MKIAILDDYQGVALRMADWSALGKRAEIAVFTDHVSDPVAVVERLRPFEVLCVMRERTPLRREVLEQLPNLRMIASTGPGNASIDMTVAAERGIVVTDTQYRSTPTIEMTWALILGALRRIPQESHALREGRWQTGIGSELHGKTLGVLGLGHVGGEVARIAQAFGMKVIAWSQNLTAEAAQAAGATLVTKDELLAQADIVSVHLILSRRTRGLLGARELALLKPTAWLINTSRGPIVDQAALISALRAKAFAGAALDVYDEEPLPKDHPFRSLENVLAMPHMGYVSEELYRTFYRDVVERITAWLDSHERGAAPAAE